MGVECSLSFIGEMDIRGRRSKIGLNLPLSENKYMALKIKADPIMIFFIWMTQTNVICAACIDPYDVINFNDLIYSWDEAIAAASCQLQSH